MNLWWPLCQRQQKHARTRTRENRGRHLAAPRHQSGAGPPALSHWMISRYFTCIARHRRSAPKRRGVSHPILGVHALIGLVSRAVLAVIPTGSGQNRLNRLHNETPKARSVRATGVPRARRDSPPEQPGKDTYGDFILTIAASRVTGPLRFRDG